MKANLKAVPYNTSSSRNPTQNQDSFNFLANKEENEAVQRMKEAALKLLEKRQNVERTQQVTQFIDQLQDSSTLHSFIREYNKEQMMATGKQKVYGFNQRGYSTGSVLDGLGALSVASISRQKMAGREHDLSRVEHSGLGLDYQSSVDYKSRLNTQVNKFRGSTQGRWKNSKTEQEGRATMNQTATSFFNSRTQKRLQTAATSNDKDNFSFHPRRSLAPKQGLIQLTKFQTQDQQRSKDSHSPEPAQFSSYETNRLQEDSHKGPGDYQEHQHRQSVLEGRSQASNQEFHSSQSGAQGKNYSQYYYYKYIHGDNRRLLVTQSAQRVKYIPETEAEQSSFKQRYQAYLDKINHEEGADFASSLDIRKLALQESLAKTELKLQLGRENRLVENMSNLDELAKEVQLDLPGEAIKGKSKRRAEMQKGNSRMDDLRTKEDRSKLSRKLSGSQFKEEETIQKQSVIKSRLVSRSASPTNQMAMQQHKLISKVQGIQNIKQENHNPSESSHFQQAKTSLFKNHAKDQSIDNRTIPINQANPKIPIQSKHSKAKRSQTQALLNIQESSSETLNTLNLQMLGAPLPKQLGDSSFKVHEPKKKRVSQAVYLDNIKKLKDFVKGDHFKVICQLDAQQQQTVQFRNCRLTKAKFRQFLNQKYGNAAIVDKLVMVFDFTNPIDFPSFVQQCENFLRNKDVLKLISFDLYDFNNDGKITELDLFKTFQFYSKGQQQQMFEHVFQADVLMLCKFLAHKRFGADHSKTQPPAKHNSIAIRIVDSMESTPEVQTKQREEGSSHPALKLRLEDFSNYHRSRLSESGRQQYFRNANNLHDPTFENKRKRVFQAMYKLQRIMGNGPNWGPHLYQIQREIEHGENSSDNEELHREENDVLGPSNHYLRLLKNQQAGKLKSGQAHTQAQIEEYKKQMTMGGGNGEQMKTLAKISRSSSLAKNTLSTYQQQKILRQINQQHHHLAASAALPTSTQVQQLNTLTSDGTSTQQTNQADGSKSTAQQQTERSQHNLLAMPLWDDFFNAYMEKAQSGINHSIRLEEFSQIKFSPDLELPSVMIDFVDYLLGVKNLYSKILTKNFSKEHVEANGGTIFDLEADLEERRAQADRDQGEAGNFEQGLKNHNLLSVDKQQPQSALSIKSTDQSSEAQKTFQAELLKLRLELTPNQYKQIINAFIVLSGHATQELIESMVGPTQAPAPKNAFMKISNSLLKTSTTVNPPSKLGAFNPLSKINVKLKEAFSEKLQLMEIYLTEQSIVQHFPTLFGGFRADIVAKLIYLYLSQGKDFVHINLIHFANSFLPLLNESKERRNEFIFRLLDVQDEKRLNVLHLLQYFKHLKTRSPLGQEILSLFMEYKDKNILMRAGYRQQIQLNFMTYSKVVKYSCLVEELQLRLFGGVFPQREVDDEQAERAAHSYLSPFQELTEPVVRPNLVAAQRMNLASGLNSAQLRNQNGHLALNKHSTMYLNPKMLGGAQQHSKNHSVLASNTSLGDTTQGENYGQLLTVQAAASKQKNRSMAAGSFLDPQQYSTNQANQNIVSSHQQTQHSKSSSQGGSISKLAASSYWFDGTIAQYIITDKQYEKLFSDQEIADASRILQKLK